MLKIKNHLCLLLVIFLLFVFSCDIMASIKLEPARIVIKSEPNQRNTGVIEVINNGEEPLLLQAYLYDWSLDARDDVITYKPGTMDNSLANYIKFNPRMFVIDRGEKQVVRYTITTPENLDKELRGIVFFENTTDMVDATTGAVVKTQIGTVLYLTPEKVQYNFKLKEVRFLTREENNLQRFLVIMENNGEAHLRFVITYKIINEKSELIEEGNLDQYVILPGNERGLVFSSKNELNHGNYKLILNYQFINSDQQRDYEIPFSIE